MLNLDELQERWIEQFRLMENNPALVSSRLAAPFFSVKPSGYDPDHHRTILYIGKATGGCWYRSSFEASRSLSERQERTHDFLSAVSGGEYHSAFWGLARRLSLINIHASETPFSNLVWSNIAKIGVTRGNPTGKYLDVQTDLAAQTLVAEIQFYRPTLVVFVSGDYAENIIELALQNFGADQNDSLWNKEISHTWWRPRKNQFPAVMCVNHPQGQLRSNLDCWVTTARNLL